MKYFSLGALLFLALPAFGGEQQVPEINTPAQSEVLEAEANEFAVHALHIALLTENQAAVASFTRPVSPAIRTLAYKILGDNGRISTYLEFLAGSLAIDLRGDRPVELAAKKAELQALVDAFRGAEAADADAAFSKILDAVQEFRRSIGDFIEENETSTSVKSFLSEQYPNL